MALLPKRRPRIFWEFRSRSCAVHVFLRQVVGNRASAFHSLGGNARQDQDQFVSALMFMLWEGGRKWAGPTDLLELASLIPTLSPPPLPPLHAQSALTLFVPRLLLLLILPLRLSLLACQRMYCLGSSSVQTRALATLD